MADVRLDGVASLVDLSLRKSNRWGQHTPRTAHPPGKAATAPAEMALPARPPQPQLAIDLPQAAPFTIQQALSDPLTEV
jgi:hypothetical protein